MKKIRSADFCAVQIDVITNFAVITNVVIKRVHCSRVAGLECISIHLCRFTDDYNNIVF